MKKNLTALSIAALQPKATAYYVGDAKQDGLRLRVAPDGKLTWNVTVRVKHGKILSVSLGRCDHEGRNGLDLSGARKRAAEIIKAARQGIDLIAIEAADRKAKAALITVSGLIEVYCRDISNPHRKGGALRTAVEIESRLKRALVTRFADPASELVRRDFAELLDAVFLRFPREAEKRRQQIDVLFKWGVSKGYLDANPMDGLPSYGTSPPRHRVLSPDEIKAFWRWLADGADNMPTDVINVLKVQFLTGARVGEVAGMTISEFSREGERLLWTLPAMRSKNKKSYTRPLVGRAREIVEKVLKPDVQGPLFCILDRSRALRAYDIGLALNNRTRPVAHFTTHDLRRTFVSVLDELGVPLETIAAAIGHRRGGAETRTLIRHYSRPNLDNRIEGALTTWDEYIDGLLKR